MGNTSCFLLKLNNEEANGMVRYTLTTTVLQKIKKKRNRIYQSPASSTFKKKRMVNLKKKPFDRWSRK